ncbi:MAG: helix-turn-helix transcriptional regulator [bacterium]|nr:helix-turn-helix transcriptional regulator [bacterium]
MAVRKVLMIDSNRRPKSRSDEVSTEGRGESSTFRQLGNEAVGANIKKVRNKLGLAQDDLVRKSGVKHTALTKIESDVVVKPSVQTAAKIAKALGVPMEDMVK